MRILKITSCKQCPHLKTEQHHTADSFEHVQKWTCKLAPVPEGASEAIIGYEEDRDQPSIPAWCPLPKK